MIDLVLAAQSGDRAAFGALYERFARFVHGILLAHADPDDVPDLVQDTFAKALASLPTLREPAAFGPWLATIARNEALMKHRARVTLVELDDQLPAPQTTQHLDGATVLAAIRALPEAFREPLILRLVEDLSGPEIAERLGRPHGSVRVNLHRGLALLRESLGSYR